jgi:hypothetical protein
MTRARLALLLALCLAVACAAPASARTSSKKAIWGPVTRDGVSQFPIYKDLGAKIFQIQLRWADVATRRPLAPRDPADPAYVWPEEISQAIAEANKHRMRVAILILTTPSWANGGKPANWAPTKPKDFADFVEAAGRRYRESHLWQIWGEPSRQRNFMPLTPENRGTPLNAAQKAAPRFYARMLDAAYGRLKRITRLNTVIGGNTFTTGDISPLNWLRSMRLPNGKAPRMDLYGHNPFSGRRPDLRKPPLRHGLADFSDLDTLARWLDRYLPVPNRRRGTLRMFLSEFLIPTDHPNWEFNFWVDRATQASWVKAALRITHSFRRIHAMGYFSLYDDAPNGRGDEVNRGLLDYQGNKKPAYEAFKQG